MKLVWHSITPLDESEGWSGYSADLRAHLDAVASDRTEIELRGVPRGGTGVGYRAFELLSEAEVARSLLDLRHRDDVDAVAVGNVYDPGVDEAREILDVPVLGYFETTLLTAYTLADRFAVVCVNDKLAAIVRDRVRTYGLGERVTEVVGSDEVDLDALSEAFTDDSQREEFVAQYADLVGSAVDDGAELVIPGGGLIPVLLRKSGISEQHGVPIVDPIGILMQTTEAHVRLHEMDAISTSRKCKYRPPSPEFLDELADDYELG